MTVNFLVAVGGQDHRERPTVAVFPFPDKAAAESFAERWTEESVTHHEAVGGHPDVCQVVDLSDPSTMDDVTEAEEHLADMADFRG